MQYPYTVTIKVKQAFDVIAETSEDAIDQAKKQFGKKAIVDFDASVKRKPFASEQERTEKIPFGSGKKKE